MIGIIVDDDLVGIPEPPIAIGYFPGKDAEVVTTKPKPRRASASQAPYVFGSESSREMTMLPRLVESKARVLTTGRVTDPGFPIVDMRGVRVSGGMIEMLRGRLILGRVSHRRRSSGGRPAWTVGVLFRRVFLRVAPLLSRRFDAHRECEGGNC
jgi:hypothetical protein